MAAAGGIDPGNTGAQQILQQGRAGANAALAAKGNAPSVLASPGQILQNARMKYGQPAAPAAGMGPGPGTVPYEGAPPPSQEAVAQAASDAQDEAVAQSAPPPSQKAILDATNAALPPEFRDKPVDDPSFWKNTAGAVENAVQDTVAATARVINNAAATPIFGQQHPFLHGLLAATGAHDTIDKFITNAATAVRGDESPAGTGAQLVADFAGLAPAMLTGAAAIPLLTAIGGEESQRQSMAQGQDATTAAKLALVGAGSNFLFAKIPMHSPEMIQRMAMGALGAAVVTPAASALTKLILNDAGYKDAASKVNPMDGESLLKSEVMSIIFGIIGGPKGQKILKEDSKPAQGAPPPSPEAVANTPMPPPPPSPEAVTVANAAAPPTAAPAAPVPDHPTAEPAAQIRAQLRDMNDPKTPRTGVLVTKDTLTNLKGGGNADAVTINSQLATAKSQGRTVDLATGTLVLKTAKIAKDLKARAAAGEDPQALVGEVTGAGTGKTADQTAVVQGRNPAGEVVTEKGVSPAEVPAAVEQAKVEGKTPVVTTPEAALAEREAGIAKEQQPTTEESQARTPVQAAPEAVAPEPKPGIYKPEKGTPQAVHVEEGAPEGKIRVRPLNDQGEPSDHTIDVPAESVRTSGTPPAETAPEPTKETVATVEAPKQEAAPKEQTAAEQAPPAAPQPTVGTEQPTGGGHLAEALAHHEEQESNKSSLKERADNAAAFASILRTAARVAPETVDSAAIDRAAAAAKPALGLSGLSTEAIAKARGISNAKINALVDEMHKAARGLLGTAKPGDEISTPVKAAVLNARLKQRAAKRATAMTEAEARALPPAKEAAPAESPQEAKLRKSKEALAAKEAAKPEVKPEPKVEIPVKPENAHELKPKELGEKDQSRLLRLKTAFVNAEDEETAGKHRTTIEQMLHDLNRPPKERAQIMHYLEQERATAKGEKTGKTMSETVEEEEAALSPEEKKGLGSSWRPAVSDAVQRLKARIFDNKMQMQWRRMAESMRDEGLFNYINLHVGTGEPMSSHFLLNQMLNHVKDPELRQLLMGVRQRAPDMPVYGMSDIRDMRTGKPLYAAGMFHGGTQTIQINPRAAAKSGLGEAFMAQTIVHEIVHSATTPILEFEEKTNGPNAARMKQLLDVLQKRLENRYGATSMVQHEMYFNDRSGLVAKPANFMRHLYGASNAHEMAAEILSNPDFKKEVAESEDWADPNEQLGTPKETLFSKIARVIGNMFGVKDPDLLRHIIGATEDTMEAQKRISTKFYTKSMQERHEGLSEAQKGFLEGDATALEKIKAAPGLRALVDEPPPLPRGIDEAVRRALPDDDETPRAISKMDQIIKGKAVDAMRQVKIGLKTVGQIFRDHMSDFGGDHPDNPLRDLKDADINKHVLMKRMADISNPVMRDWARLKAPDERAMAALMRDTTMYRIDPRLSADAQPATAKGRAGFEDRHADYVRRYEQLSPEAQKVYSDAADANKTMAKELRRAGIDTATSALNLNLAPEQKSLLYGAKNPKVYDTIIGPGKLIDVGEDNDKLKAAVQDFAGMTEIEGPYFHLGRQGDYVVGAKPEGTREFADAAKANEWAARVRELSPGSKAEVAERGGKHVVDYKAQYVSMHETRALAEAEQKRLEAAGFDPGLVTQKTLGKDTAPLASGLKDIVAEAERKITRNGHDEGSDALVASLRSAFLQMTAARSAYAGSKLARKNIGGVKAADMQRNFASHAMSTTWHAAQMRTVFDQAAALGRVRAMARENTGTTQQTAYRRGEVVAALNRHAAQATRDFGQHSPVDSWAAKLGFMNYLASGSHALIWMTQNFTTGIPWAGARYGYGKSTAAFMKGMKVIGPGLRSAMAGVFSKPGEVTASDIHDAIIKYVSKDPTLGKWTPALQQLIDRGVLNHSYAEQLGAVAQGSNQRVNNMLSYARILPSMADAFNRVSTALAGLELTNGDIRKTADLVETVHADYSQENKPLYVKKLGGFPGGKSLAMFTTYMQEMTHLLYSNISNTVTGRGEGRVTAAKTVAGLLLGNAAFTGMYGGMAIAPVQLAAYAYHKLFDQDGPDLKTAVHMFLVDHLGKAAGNVAAYGLPHAMGMDISSRMGLAGMFMYDPPDLLSEDMGAWQKFALAHAGPPAQFVAQASTSFMKHWNRGEPFQAASSLIPIKQYQDAVKAVGLATHGKTDTLGAQMTGPSTGDALWQLLGFKPASVAKAQEQQSIRIEAATAAKAERGSILKEFASAQDADSQQHAIERMTDFNSRHPESAIGTKDLQGEMTMRAKDEAGFSKSPAVQERTNF